MEIMNEFTFWITSYSFITFTDFVEDIEVKNAAGWCIIGATLMNIGINYLVVIYKTIQQVV